MYRPSEIDLLTAWEWGHAAPEHASVPLFLLSAMCPDDPVEALSQLSVGQRDAYLLQLREHLFGATVAGISECISCGEVLEVSLDLETLKLHAAETESPGLISINEQEYAVLVRLPNTFDLVAICMCRSSENAKAELLNRIVVSSTLCGVPISVADLPGDLVELIDSSLNSADPQANIQLRLECVGCGRMNEVLFDIGYLLWREIDAWAVRLLRDIHELALSYGWSEAEILHMNSWRRRCYLEMLRA